MRSTHHCKATLKLLVQRPDITRFIRKLVVRPNLFEWAIPEEQLSEFWVSGLIERMAPNLPLLHTFIWDGIEMPSDKIWTTLRLSYVDLTSEIF